METNYKYKFIIKFSKTNSDKIISLFVFLILMFSLNVFSQTTRTIGTGTTYQTNAPFVRNYNYGWSKMIYLQSEIATNGSITHIAFENNTGSVTSWTTQKIYMRHTSAATVTTARPTGAELTSSWTLVYDGTIDYNSNYKTIDITDFAYNNTDNLEIYYLNYKATNSSNGPQFRYTAGTSRYCYYRNDIKATFDANVTGTAGNFYINNKLTISCTNPTIGGTIASDESNSGTWDPSNITSSVAASDQVGGAIEYKWQYSTTSNTGPWSDISSSNSATYDPSSISTTTWYKRLARVVCKSDWTGAAESNVIEKTCLGVCTAPTLNAVYDSEESKTICSGSSYTLGAGQVGGSGCSGSWEYAWYTGTGSDNTYWNGTTWTNAETYNSAYSSIIGVGPNTTTTYKVKCRCSADVSCNSSDATGVTVTVNTSTVANAGSDQIICGATTATLSGNTPASGSSTWALISGEGIITTPSVATSGITSLGDGNNIFRWTLDNGACADSYDEVTISGANTSATINTPISGNGVAVLSWTNPGCQTDEIMIVAKASSSVTGTPSGDGSAYTANATYSSGTSFGGGYVVYKGLTTTQLVKGLTNGTTYYLKFYKRYGTSWASLGETTVIPSASAVNYYINDASTTGDIYSTAIGGAYNGTTYDGLAPNKAVNSVQDIIDNYVLTDSDILLIDAGDYTESITLSASDMGSSTAPLKFIGAGSSKTIFTAEATSNNMSLSYDVEYIWIDGIRFNNSNDNKHNIYKEYGDYLTVKNCYLDITSTTASLGINIYLKSITDAPIHGNNCIISKNIITNSSEDGYGIHLLGDNDFNTISFNTITMTGADAYAIYCKHYFQSAGNEFWPTQNTINDNTISSVKTAIKLVGGDYNNNLQGYNIFNNLITLFGNTDADNSGMYLYACGKNTSSDNPFNIYSNKVKNGFAAVYCDNSTDGISVYNNFICSSKYGLYSYDDYTENIHKRNQLYHNSMYTSESCVYFNDGTNSYDTQKDWDIRNNILYTTSSSSSRACLEFYDTYDADDDKIYYCNNNILYAPNGANIAKWHSFASYTTLASWQGADMVSNGTSNDANSFGVDPKFINCSSCFLDILYDDLKAGVDLSVTDDIHGTGRSIPHIGAYEGIEILPIELISFTASCENEISIVKWTTATEINNDYFTLESSNDGINYEVVATITGSGSSNIERNYEYYDMSPYSEGTYYRLKQTDFDGTSSYSQIVYVGCDKFEQIDFEYINMIDSKNNKTLTILFNSSEGDKYYAQLYDITGRLLISNQGTTENGLNATKFDTKELSSGVYLIVLNNESTKISKKVLLK